MVLEMRRRGVRIDVAAAERARDYCRNKRDAALAELSEKLGAPVSMKQIASPKWKADTFDAHGIKYPLTKNGNPSFRAGKLGWMRKHDHFLTQGIVQANRYNDAAEKFLNGHILAHIIDGRIYSEIHPHRSEDDFGTVSSRFSYSDPPLQQMPIRDKELGPMIRNVFLPEEGETIAAPDVSQQEFRFIVHHAELRDLRMAKGAAEAYRTDPNADFHAIVGEMTGIPRDDAKAINFGKAFGARQKKFAEMTGKPLAEALKLYAQYDAKMPFVSQLAHRCEREAKARGYTVLYDDARRHWTLYEAYGVFVEGAGPCHIEEARRRTKDPGHPWYQKALRRHKTYTAFNAFIQGSAARHTKLWMLAVYRAGIVPLLQLHDALICSVRSKEEGELIARLGSEAVQLNVPIRVDLKFGKTWGDATRKWEDLGAEAALDIIPTAPEPTTAPESVRSLDPAESPAPESAPEIAGCAVGARGARPGGAQPGGAQPGGAGDHTGAGPRAQVWHCRTWNRAGTPGSPTGSPTGSSTGSSPRGGARSRSAARHAKLARRPGDARAGENDHRYAAQGGGLQALARERRISVRRA